MTNTKEKASPALPARDTGSVTGHLRYSPLENGRRFPGEIVSADGEWIALLGSDGTPAGIAAAHAKGVLLAAAPALLIALRDIVQECAGPNSPFYTTAQPYGGPDSWLPEQFIKQAEIALLKALGKEAR